MPAGALRGGGARTGLERATGLECPQFSSNMEETAFGAGGFREAFKATSKHKEYSYTTWVVKHYLDKSLEDMRTLGQTPEQH